MAFGYNVVVRHVRVQDDVFVAAQFVRRDCGVFAGPIAGAVRFQKGQQIRRFIFRAAVVGLNVQKTAMFGLLPGDEIFSPRVERIEEPNFFDFIR